MARPLRDRLNTAADLLQEGGHDDAAADVRAVLAPGGWTLLRPQAGEGAGPGSNLALTMVVSLKSALIAAADEFGVSLSAVTHDGFRAVRDGRWLPPKTLTDMSRHRPNSSTKTNLNVRVSDALLREVDAMLPGLSKKLGYRVSRSGIAIAWLAEELGVDRPSGADSVTLKLVTSKRLVDFLLEQEKVRGLSLPEVVEAGVRDLLAGVWEPRLSQWASVSERARDESARWQSVSRSGPREPVHMAKLSLRIDEELMAGLREWCADRTEQSEIAVHPGGVAIALLKERVGEPPAE